eukprot:TRINITY_DN7350_c0_g1_i1.p1 TRINITY_DN7350_c0_g1~~TRINITY_DN7350_c0_g1_i1.p1  ORF type:complete len:108 (+),score=13.99 TRINITY_DN7350_c0_g1_i1:322-645(+)
MHRIARIHFKTLLHHGQPKMNLSLNWEQHSNGIGRKIVSNSDTTKLQAPSPPNTQTIPPKEKVKPVREWSILIEDLRKSMELRLKIHYLVTSQDGSRGALNYRTPGN